MPTQDTAMSSARGVSTPLVSVSGIAAFPEPLALELCRASCMGEPRLARIGSSRCTSALTYRIVRGTMSRAENLGNNSETLLSALDTALVSGSACDHASYARHQALRAPSWALPMPCHAILSRPSLESSVAAK